MQTRERPQWQGQQGQRHQDHERADDLDHPRSLIREQHQQQRLLRVEPILGLIEHDGGG